MLTLRTTWRGLIRTPVTSLIAVLSLALGIGANTAIFSLLDQVLLRTLPVQNPHELAYLYHPGPMQGSMSSDESGNPSFSYPMFRELQREQTPFTGLAGAQGITASLAYENHALHGSARLVSGNYFQLLGVRPALGRLLDEQDDQTPGAHPLVVLNHRYWSRQFGGNPSVLNQTLIVNGRPLTIVGVAQAGFEGERMGRPPDVFVPLSMKKELTPDWDGLQDRRNYWITLFGRRKPDVSLEAAEAAINVAYRPQLEQDVALLRGDESFIARFRAKKIILKPGQHGRGGLREQGRLPLLLLMGMTGMVLLLACANVANLQLARAAGRAREIAVRLAIGATRRRLIGQLLAESCALALAGGLLGVLAGQWTLRLILAAVPASDNPAGFLSSDLDGRVLLFCLGLSLASGIFFGLFPALQASKPDLVHWLKAQSGQATEGRQGLLRKSLVTVQVAISLLLLATAGLFVTTLVNLTHVELGIRADHLVTFSLTPKLNQYRDEQIASFYDQLLARLRAIPGVQLASAAEVPAIAGRSNNWTLNVEGFTPSAPDDANSNYNLVGTDYFRTLSIPLVAGREFTPGDLMNAPKVAIVNEAFVRHYLAGQNALGRRFARGRSTETIPDLEIVGVVKDAKYSEMRQPPPRVFYTPYAQSRPTNLFFYLRTAIAPQQVVALVLREVAALDPNLPVRRMMTMEDQLRENLFAERLISTLCGSFALLATVLASVGLYGVLAYDVARRTREIGIRMALGAGVRQVRKLIAREVGLMLILGTLVGASLAAAAGVVARAVLFGVEPWSPTVYAAAIGLLWLVALAAAYVPTQRAVQVDPMKALRHE